MGLTAKAGRAWQVRGSRILADWLLADWQEIRVMLNECLSSVCPVIEVRGIRGVVRFFPLSRLTKIPAEAILLELSKRLLSPLARLFSRSQAPAEKEPT